MNYLRQIPGRTGIPLSYVVHRTAIPPPVQFFDPLLDNYITNASLGGPSYLYDNRSVHTLLLTFITKYTEIEAVVRTATDNDGRVAYMALVTRFEGVGAMSPQQHNANTEGKAANRRVELVLR